jgi:glycosyltransferase involved in cell wall biosynthesis
MYADRYPKVPRTRWALIANGYDEESFSAAEQIVAERTKRQSSEVLVHSGTLYPSPDRDPSAFLVALTLLRQAGKIGPEKLKIVFRATGFDGYYRRLIDRYGLGDLVFLEPALPYREALAEMLSVTGLLLFQGHDSNPAVPAKLYEYIRAKRPIFAMVAPEGDTATTLEAFGVGKLVPLTNAEEIATGLLEFLQDIRDERSPIASFATINSQSRMFRTRELATLFESMDEQVV